MTVIVYQIVLSIPKMTVQVKNQNDRFQNARYLAFIHRIRKLTVISVLAWVQKILVQTRVQTRVQTWIPDPDSSAEISATFYWARKSEPLIWSCIYGHFKTRSYIQYWVT